MVHARIAWEEMKNPYPHEYAILMYRMYRHNLSMGITNDLHIRAHRKFHKEDPLGVFLPLEHLGGMLRWSMRGAQVIG